MCLDVVLTELSEWSPENPFMIDVALFLCLCSISKQRLEEEEAVARWLDSSLLRGRPRQVGYHPRHTHLSPNALCNNRMLATDPVVWGGKLTWQTSVSLFHWGASSDWIGTRSRDHWKRWCKMETKTSNSAARTRRSCLESGKVW